MQRVVVEQVQVNTGHDTRRVVGVTGDLEARSPDAGNVDFSLNGCTCPCISTEIVSAPMVMMTFTLIWFDAVANPSCVSCLNFEMLSEKPERPTTTGPTSTGSA